MARDTADLNIPGQHISWFDDLGSGNEDYNFLSNFYIGDPITLPGVTWENAAEVCQIELDKLYMGDTVPSGAVKFATGEHAFAAFKAWGTDFSAFEKMALSKDPGEVKAIGRRCKLRPDWEVVKLDVMAAVIRAKFTLDREEGTRLLKTGTALLTEGTFWGDTVWGIDLNRPGNEKYGRNWLGTLLMARRAELFAESLYGRKHDALAANADFVSVADWRPSWQGGRR